MKRYIPVIVVVLVLAGTVTFAMTRGKNSDDNKPTSNTSQKTSKANAFDAVSTSGLSFEATLTTTSGDKTYTSVMESDAKTGAVRYVGGTAGTDINMIYTKDAYYMCQSADKCFKYALGQGSGASFDPKAYQYGDDKISQYKSSTTSLGKESCPAGTCNVWKVTNDNYESKIYIDTKTKRVNQVVSNTASGSTKIVYEYKDVTVEIPQNAQTLPSVSLPTAQ